MIEAGKLRHRIAIIEPGGSGTDADNQPIEDWTDPQTIATVWGSIDQTRGREFYEGRAQLGSDTYRVRIRYQSELDSRRHRLVSGGETYKIESIDNVSGRNKELLIVATKIEAGG